MRTLSHLLNHFFLIQYNVCLVEDLNSQSAKSHECKNYEKHKL